MAFDFPDSPAVGDEYTLNGAIYTWTGLVWDLGSAGTTADFVLKAGDTMQGPLNFLVPEYNITGVLTGGVNTMDVNIPTGGKVAFKVDGVETASYLGSEIRVSGASKYIRTNSGASFVWNNTDNNAWQTFMNANGGIQLQYHQGGNNDGRLRVWTTNGGYSDTWVFETTIVSGTPGITVNGTCSANQLVNRGSNHIRCSEVDGFGIQFYGGAYIYKRSGYGCVLRKHSQNTQWKIEQNDGSGVVDIATASLTTFLDMGLALPELENEPEIQAFAREDNDNKGFDVAKVIGLLFAKIKALECEIDVLKKRK